MVSRSSGGAAASAASSSSTFSRNILPSNQLHHGHSKGKRPAALASSPDVSHPAMHRKKSRTAASAVNGAATNMTANAATGPVSYSKGMFLAFVDNALQERRKGRSGPYNELVSQFRTAANDVTTSEAGAVASTSVVAPTSSTLKAYIEALTYVVAQLDRNHTALVEAITSLPWVIMEEPFILAYSRFIQALLCARSEFVQPALEKIVRSLRFHSAIPLQALGDDSAHSRQTTRRQAYDRLHNLLSSLIYLIPTLPTTIWPLMNKYFPHKRENRNAQAVYITNALRIVEYCPQLGENVLNAIVIRALEIDAEIQVDIEEFENDDGELDEEVFGYSVENAFDRFVGDEDESDDEDDENEASGNLDDLSSGSDEDGDDTEGEQDKPKQTALSPKALKRLKDMAAKLDAIMRAVFDFLLRLSSQPTSAAATPMPIEKRRSFLSDAAALPSPGSAATANIAQQMVINGMAMPHLSSTLLKRTINDVLLAIFDEKVLQTFKTRHVQFIFFWYSSLSPEFADNFSGALLGRALDERDTPVVTRISAAAYTASFVARANSIDATAARRVMALLCTYLEDELEELRVITAEADLALSAAERAKNIEQMTRKRVVFYAICQATLYIFCFRWRDFLQETENDIEELEGVPPSRRWMSELEAIRTAVSSSFNPLQVCAPIVVAQFARMAHKTDFMYCHSIIESNKRQSRLQHVVAASPDSDASSSEAQPVNARLPVPSTESHAARVQQTLKAAQIDSHFPFDPYKLPLSASYIQPAYRIWESGFADDDEDDEEDGEAGTDSAASADGAEQSDIDMSGTSAATDSSIEQAAIHRLIKQPIANAELIDPELLVSQSFEAMSVSPRYHLLTSRPIVST